MPSPQQILDNALDSKSTAQTNYDSAFAAQAAAQTAYNAALSDFNRCVKGTVQLASPAGVQNLANKWILDGVDQFTSQSAFVGRQITCDDFEITYNLANDDLIIANQNLTNASTTLQASIATFNQAVQDLEDYVIASMSPQELLDYEAAQAAAAAAEIKALNDAKLAEDEAKSMRQLRNGFGIAAGVILVILSIFALGGGFKKEAKSA